MKLVHYTGLASRGVMKLLNEAMIYFDQHGFEGDYPGLHWEQNAIVILNDDDEPVAITTYEYLKHMNSIHIHVSYVKSGYRREGLYTLLWEKMKEIAKEKGTVKISSVTSPKNFAMQAVLAEQGRQIVALTYEYKLETETPSTPVGLKGDDKPPF